MKNMPDINIKKQKEGDHIPLTLSIETLDGICSPLIKRGTPIPVAKVSIFTTTVENQSSLKIHVLQGEREMASDNKTLARFIVDGIPPAPCGIPQIEVKFDIDANGILNLTAKDKMSAQGFKIIPVTISAGLSQNGIEQILRDDEKHEKRKGAKLSLNLTQDEQ